MRRRSSQAPRRYEPRAKVLALDPKAFFEFFMMPETRDPERVGDTVIIDIDGPLEQHAGGWCDSYEAIQGRVSEACAGDAKAIVMRIDSPGGDVAGCFDAVRAIRAECATADKPLYAYVTGKACSAGYALASAAGLIVLSDSALVGSIGVISTREDYSAMNAARGLRVALITSGARKADGHPDAPITDDELIETQLVIDSLAGVFFALVEENRGIAAKDVAAQQARIFHGDAAIRAGLADTVQSFESMLAQIASGGMQMATAYEKARNALEEAAGGDDANAAAAKRALAAMDEGNEEAAAEGGDEPPADDEKPPKKKDDESAEADPPADDDDEKKKKDEEAAAAARAPSGELSALAEVHKLRAELAAKEERSERKRLIASRKDFAPEMVKALQSAPLATVRELVKTLPKAPAAKPAATVAVAGTRGANQGGTDPTPTAAVTDMDRRMGLTTSTFAVWREGNAQVFGVQEKPLERPSGVGGGAK